MAFILMASTLNPKPLAPLKAIPDPADIVILNRRLQSVASKGSSYVSMRQCPSVAQNYTLNLASIRFEAHIRHKLLRSVT